LAAPQQTDLPIGRRFANPPHVRNVDWFIIGADRSS
jgi:hypothetical protein